MSSYENLYNKLTTENIKEIFLPPIRKLSLFFLTKGYSSVSKSEYF